MLLLLPSDPLRPRSTDPHFLSEAQAARELGFDVALVDHDALVAGHADEAVARVPHFYDAVYRGWMVSSDQYRALEAALSAREAALRTTSASFKSAHELPGWYEALTAHTPESFWSVGSDAGAIAGLCARFGSGPAVLRDYVKSMKHYWAEACFVPDVAYTASADRIARRFIELRDDSFTGGLVLRRFEEFSGPEVRTWWVRGQRVLTTAHPDTPNDLPDPSLALPDLTPTIEALGLAFVTVDFALRGDDQWRVVELGDGQVSDRPATTDPGDLIACL